VKRLCKDADMATGLEGAGSGERGASLGRRSGARAVVVLVAAFTATCGGAGGHVMPPPADSEAGAPPPDASVPPPLLPSSDAGAPDAGTCAAESHRAEPVTANVHFVVDTSTSMAMAVAGAAPTSKWTLVQGALTTFVSDPLSAGLAVGLRFFPEQSAALACHADADCGVAFPQDRELEFSCFSGRTASRYCTGPGITTPTTTCSEYQPCATGFRCETAGTCAGTGRACWGDGKDCATGVAGDTCQISARCQCSGWAYEPPSVELAPLPAGRASLAAGLAERRPGGATPLGLAMRGALRHLQGHLAGHPGETGALVVISDGGRDIECLSPRSDPAEVARTGRPGVATYAIGVFSPARVTTGTAFLTSLAAAGGTGAPLILEPNADLDKALLAALAGIRARTLPCEYTIPETTARGPLDYGQVNVHYARASADQTILYVAGPAGCDPQKGGWYYDVNPAQGRPSKIITCASTCQLLRSDLTAQVDLRFGCATRIIE
jgi:hypothetical protein